MLTTGASGEGVSGERKYRARREKQGQSPRGQSKRGGFISEEAPGAGNLVYFPEIPNEDVLMGCLFSPEIPKRSDTSRHPFHCPGCLSKLVMGPWIVSNRPPTGALDSGC